MPLEMKSSGTPRPAMVTPTQPPAPRWKQAHGQQRAPCWFPVRAGSQSVPAEPGWCFLPVDVTLHCLFFLSSYFSFSKILQFFFFNSFLISFRPCVIAVSSGRPFQQPEIKQQTEGERRGGIAPRSSCSPSRSRRSRSQEFAPRLSVQDLQEEREATSTRLPIWSTESPTCPFWGSPQP